MDPESRLYTRREVARFLRPHLASIVAIAIAADQAALALTSAMAPGPRKSRYQPKTRGQISATLWGEGVREWVQQARPPGLRVYAPHDWTELVVHDALHVRIQKDRTRPATPRRQRRGSQQQEATLPLFDKNAAVTNVDILTEYSSLSGGLRQVRITAPLIPGQVWAPIPTGLEPGRRQLHRWRQRGVPWLEVCNRTAEMARFKEFQRDAAASREALVTGLAAIAELPAHPDAPRATFRPKERRDTTGDVGNLSDGNGQ